MCGFAVICTLNPRTLTVARSLPAFAAEKTLGVRNTVAYYSD